MEAGVYSLEITHIGYEMKSVPDIDLIGKFSQSFTIVLSKKAFYADKILVTATRQLSDQKEIPVPLNVISADDISLRLPQTTAELLREETGLFVQKTNHGGGSPIIRGLGSNQILILVDGIRLNNSTYRLGNHQYLTTVDAFMLDKVEVIRGPGSMLYGSDALGGVINTITPELRVSNDFSWNSDFIIAAASADESARMHVGFGFTDKNYAFQIGSSIKKYGDLTRGKNHSNPDLEKSKNGAIQSPSGFHAGDLFFKWLFKLSLHDRLIWGYQYSRQYEVPRYDKYENNDYFIWQYEPQERHLTYFRLENDLNTRFVQQLQTTISYHRQTEGRLTQKSADSQKNDELDHVQSFGLIFQANGYQNAHKYVMGIDTYFDKVESRRWLFNSEDSLLNSDLRGRYPNDAVYLNSGIFLNDQWNFAASTFLNMGIRYSYFYTDFKTSSEQQPLNSNFDEDFQALTLSAGLAHQLNNVISLDLGIRQGFRAPNLSDLGKVGESKGTTFEISNTDLLPEKLLSFDAGLKFDSKLLKAEIFVYYSHLTDLISSAPDSLNGNSQIDIGGQLYDIRSKQNIGSGYITGFESGIKWLLSSDLNAFGNLTWTYGENTSLNEPMGGIPPVIGKLGINYGINRYMIELFSRFAGKQSRLSEDDMQDPRIPDGGSSAWYSLNFRFAGPITDDLQFVFGIENIMDQNYREHGSGINSPGRNFHGRISWTLGRK